MTAFYDEQMAVIVEQAMDYLLSERGKRELQKAAKESAALAEKFRKMRDVSWERFHAPFTIGDLETTSNWRHTCKRF